MLLFKKARNALNGSGLGLVVIRVPDLSNLKPENAQALLSISREHVYYFTETTLKQLLLHNGFQIISINQSGSQLVGGETYSSVTIFARSGSPDVRPVVSISDLNTKLPRSCL